MKPEVPEKIQKHIFSKIFVDLSQVAEAVNLLMSYPQPHRKLTVLVKTDHNSKDMAGQSEKQDRQLQKYLTDLLGPETDSGFFNNQEIGTVFIAGALSSIFLHDVEGKKLAALSKGPYGILRGLGVNEPEAAHYVAKLKEGKYLLMVRGLPLDNDLLSEIKKIEQV